MTKTQILLLLASVLLTSCTIYKEYPIEIYKPGEVSLPAEAKTIALVSRNFKYPADTLQQYYQADYNLKKENRFSARAIDSLAITSALGGLSSALQSGEKSANIKQLPYGYIQPHKGEKLPVFSMDAVNEISNETRADVLISLETFSCFYSTFSSSVSESPASEVITAGVWSVIDTKLRKVIDHKQMIDTIYWNEYDEQTGRKTTLPPRIDAIKTAAQMAGESFANRLAPSWQQTSRMFILPPVEDFRLAAQNFTEGKWEDAIKIWSVYAPEKYGKLSIAAMYNIALALEMGDQIDEALTMIVKAETLAKSWRSSNDLKTVGLYKKILSQRKAELKRIEQQTPTPSPD